MLDCGNHLYCHLFNLEIGVPALFIPPPWCLRGHKWSLRTSWVLLKVPCKAWPRDEKRTLVCNSSPNWWKQPKNDLVSYYTWDTTIDCVGIWKCCVLGYGNVVCWTSYNQIVEFTLCGWLGVKTQFIMIPLFFCPKKIIKMHIYC
jgi:hypothetical protein